MDRSGQVLKKVVKQFIPLLQHGNSGLESWSPNTLTTKADKQAKEQQPYLEKVPLEAPSPCPNILNFQAHAQGFPEPVKVDVEDKMSFYNMIE